jgi:hypothetical protein
MVASPLQNIARGVVLASLFVACNPPLDRTAGLEDGQIRFTPRRADGALAERATVEVNGGWRVTQIQATHDDDDDAFLLSGLVPGPWLFRVVEDDDGDGVPERGAWVDTTVALAPVPKSLTDGCTGQPRDVVTSQLLGDVTLADTGGIDVTSDVPAGLEAFAVAWRDVGGYATSVEAMASLVDGAGTLRGVVAGPVHVAVFAYDPAVGPGRPSVFGTKDLDVDGQTAAAVDLAESAQTDGAPRTTPVQLEAVWNLPDPAKVTIPQVFATRTDGSDPTVPDDTGFLLDEDGRALVTDLPIGVLDISLTSATEGASDGLFRRAVVVPGGAPIGPVEMPLLADPCLVPIEGDDVSDCDRDGLLSADDPDDDGDGQPDADEPACTGPGLGTDFDADDACAPANDDRP